MKLKRRILITLTVSILAFNTLNVFAKNFEKDNNVTAEVVEMTIEQSMLNNVEQYDLIDNMAENYITVEDVTCELLPMTPEQIEFNNKPADVTDQLININPLLRGDKIPTDVYDLSSGSYKADFGTGSLNIRRTYTNYYFRASSSGILWVPIDQIKCGGDITIIIYEVSSNTQVGSFTGAVPQAGMNVKFSGLSTTKHYYFLFTCESPNYITGYSLINNK